jgi:hypothetical protein
MSTAERTRLALESITSGKIAAARPSTVTLKDNAASEYIRYTPASTSDEGKHAESAEEGDGAGTEGLADPALYQ